MKKLLIVLWLLTIRAAAQTPNIPIRLDFPGYEGNPIEVTIPLSAADTSKVFTARATTTSAENSPLVFPQPTVQRVGLGLLVRFATTRKELDRAWVEVKAGNLKRWAGYVLISKTPTQTSAPIAIQYIATKGDKGDPGAPCTLSLTYQLDNTPPNYTIGHNKGSVYVKATFFQGDTKQEDPLWRIRIDNQNAITLLGPPLERFTGQLFLEFFNQTN